MLDIIFAIVIILIVVFGFSRFRGHNKNDIQLDLDERSANPDKQSEAIIQELESKGRDVKYERNGRFVVDGKPYIMQVRSKLGGGGISYQKTVLKPIK